MKPARRLRQRRLTEKPRIVQFSSGAARYYVERLHAGGYAEVRIALTFREAINIALEWAGPKDA